MVHRVRGYLGDDEGLRGSTCVRSAAADHHGAVRRDPGAGRRDRAAASPSVMRRLRRRAAL